MTVRAIALSFATLVAITFWGLAVYSDGAIAGNVPVDGYGISVRSAAVN